LRQCEGEQCDCGIGCQDAFAVKINVIHGAAGQCLRAVADIHARGGSGVRGRRRKELTSRHQHDPRNIERSGKTTPALGSQHLQHRTGWGNCHHLTRRSRSGPTVVGSTGWAKSVTWVGKLRGDAHQRTRMSSGHHGDDAGGN
jgi:hypothetical protein